MYYKLLLTDNLIIASPLFTMQKLVQTLVKLRKDNFQDGY